MRGFRSSQFLQVGPEQKASGIKTYTTDQFLTELILGIGIPESPPRIASVVDQTLY